MDGGSRYLLESGDRHGLVRIDDVEQMMRNRRLLVRVGLAVPMSMPRYIW